ncbi:MAG: hypothetical protein P4L50_13510 [Anaerolineaceae bacterium]|nr:hypothetical protein [Anaerolineaceae bacterium]
MPQTTQRKRQKPSIEAQIALAERVLKGLHKSLDEEIARTRDLEIEHDLALYKAGRNPLCDGNASIQEARRRVG